MAKAKKKKAVKRGGKKTKKPATKKKKVGKKKKPTKIQIARAQAKKEKTEKAAMKELCEPGIGVNSEMYGNQPKLLPGNNPLKNAKHERFCQELLVDNNKAKAYQRAYKCSDKVADTAGPRLFGNVRVGERVRYLQGDLSEKSGVTAEKVIAEFAKIAFSNEADYVYTDSEGDLRFKDFDAIGRDKLAAVESIKVTKKTIYGDKADKYDNIVIVTTQFKLHSKTRALESLGKHLGIFERDNKQKADSVLKSVLDIINGQTKGKLPKDDDKDSAKTS